MIVRIDINHEENRTVIEKEKATNVLVVENVFLKRKSHMRDIY